MKKAYLGILDPQTSKTIGRITLLLSRSLIQMGHQMLRKLIPKLILIQVLEQWEECLTPTSFQELMCNSNELEMQQQLVDIL
jgi:hypothetical protein